MLPDQIFLALSLVYFYIQTNCGYKSKVSKVEKPTAKQSCYTSSEEVTRAI